MPKIYPITDVRLSNLSHLAQTERLCAGGAKLIQLREKYLSSGEFYMQAREAVEYAHARGVKIIINDRADIALAAGADGVHLGQDDLPPAEARKILGSQAIIGFSTHNLAQLAAARTMPVDYLAFGPVFETATKENADAVVHICGVREARRAAGSLPLVAIGGIGERNLAEIFRAGADSAALISAIVADGAKITENYQNFSRLSES